MPAYYRGQVYFGAVGGSYTRVSVHQGDALIRLRLRPPLLRFRIPEPRRVSRRRAPPTAFFGRWRITRPPCCTHTWPATWRKSYTIPARRRTDATSSARATSSWCRPSPTAECTSARPTEWRHSVYLIRRPRAASITINKCGARSCLPWRDSSRHPGQRRRPHVRMTNCLAEAIPTS